jgi:hypothetical protein
MAHFVSQPALRPFPALTPSRTAQNVQYVQYVSALPDAYDARYPRRWWPRALRVLASGWWAPLVVYLTQATALLLLAEQAARFAAPPDGGMVAQALHIDWAPAFILEQPAGLVIIVLGIVALLLAFIGLAAAGRWAEEDRRQEAQVLTFRLARPEERLNAAFVQQALAPALAWRLRTASIRRRLATLALASVSIAAGVLIAFSQHPLG